MKNWIYNEKKHCGVDYSNEDLANNYDQQHQSFRNYEKEFLDMIEFLSLKNPESITAIDLGCGTGATTVFAARTFKKVYGVDVSDMMIKNAKRKLKDADLSKIDFINKGFLSYNHTHEPVDLVITKAAFHHLPDFWKQIALLNMNKMLKKGGILYIFDIVFHFEAKDYEEKIEKWLEDFEKKAGADFKKEVETHIGEEFSTFKWIMDGMLEKAGFSIEACRTPDDFITEYHCIKQKEI